MAIAFDVANASDGNFDSTLSPTALTVGTLTNGILTIWVSRGDGTETVTALTVNGGSVLANFVGAASYIDTGDRLRRVDLYYKIAPSSGSNTVVATLSAATTAWSIGLGSWQGVHQTVPFGTPVTPAGADSVGPATTDVTTTSGDVVLAGVAWGTGSAQTMTVGAGQTSRINNGATGSSAIAVSDETAAGATTTMSWTIGVAAAQWAIMAVILKAVGAGGRTSKNTQTMPPGMGLGIAPGAQMPR